MSRLSTWLAKRALKEERERLIKLGYSGYALEAALAEWAKNNIGKSD